MFLYHAQLRPVMQGLVEEGGGGGDRDGLVGASRRGRVT